MGGEHEEHAGVIIDVCPGTIRALLDKGHIQGVTGAPHVYMPTNLGRKVLGKLLGEQSAVDALKEAIENNEGGIRGTIGGCRG